MIGDANIRENSFSFNGEDVSKDFKKEVDVKCIQTMKEAIDKSGSKILICATPNATGVEVSIHSQINLMAIPHLDRGLGEIRKRLAITSLESIKNVCGLDPALNTLLDKMISDMKIDKKPFNEM